MKSRNQKKETRRNKTWPFHKIYSKKITHIRIVEDSFSYLFSFLIFHCIDKKACSFILHSLQKSKDEMKNLRKASEEEMEILRAELDETKSISDKVSKEKEDLSKDFDVFRQSSSNFKVDFYSFLSSFDNTYFIMQSAK